MAAQTYHRRTLETTVRRVAETFPALVLTGPRQSGKTTVLRRLGGKARHYASLDDLALRELAQADPRLFLERFPPPVLIDEIQHAPSLLPQVKLAVDEDRTPGAFWLTGSQQFRVMKGVTETLAGRAAVLHLLGFSAREVRGRQWDVEPFLPTDARMKERGRPRALPSASELYEQIWQGSFPALHAGAGGEREVYLSSYLQTYLERDVRELTQVGDLQAFSRFVRACAARTTQLLNLSDLARDVDVSVPTAKRWLSVLEASYQVYLLQPYHSNVTKRLVKRPKLYFLDTGLCAYLTGWTSPRTLMNGAMAGAILETHVVAEVLKSWWHRGVDAPAFYYRDKDGREVDLLLFVDGQLHPVEVKRAATVRRQWRDAFACLDRLAVPLGEGLVACLAPDAVPLNRQVTAVHVATL